jgi:hypothetical protein
MIRLRGVKKIPVGLQATLAFIAFIAVMFAISAPIALAVRKWGSPNTIENCQKKCSGYGLIGNLVDAPPEMTSRGRWRNSAPAKCECK